MRDGLVAALDPHEAEQHALDRSPEPRQAGLGSAAFGAAAARAAGTSARIGSSPARAASRPRLNIIPSMSGNLTERSASSSLAISSRTGASSGEPSSASRPSASWSAVIAFSQRRPSASSVFATPK